MKYCILSFLLLIGAASVAQNTPKYEFENVQIQNKIPGVKKKQSKQLAFAVRDYLLFIEKGNYDKWHASFSDSTRSRLNTHKFKNKFNRLKGYNISTELIKIVSVTALETPTENETGTEYEVIVELNTDMDVSNRVNFDKLKTTDDNDNKRKLAMNLVLNEKLFTVCIHSYVERGDSNYDEDRKLWYTFDNVEVYTGIPGMGQGKIRRLSGLLNTYLGAIESDNYDLWYGTFSDSTISRVAPHKFPNKFRRMKEYGITTSTIKIISVNRLSAPFENEVGTEYEVVLELDAEMNVANRVSFDRLKRGENNANKRRIAVNVIANEKGYQMIVHKYSMNGKNMNGNNNSGKK